MADRRWARIWRTWPLAGAALVLLASMLLGDVVSPARTVLGVALAAYVGIGTVLFLRGGPARVPVRAMSVMVMPVAVDPTEQQWQIRARCRGLDRVFFGADREGRRERKQRERRAKQLCAQCPVIRQCRDHAISTGEPFGIWGGLSASEREALMPPEL